MALSGGAVTGRKRVDRMGHELIGPAVPIAHEVTGRPLPEGLRFIDIRRDRRLLSGRGLMAGAPFVGEGEQRAHIEIPDLTDRWRSHDSPSVRAFDRNYPRA